jgi:hypothetical protein
LTGDDEPSASGWVREHVEQIMRTGTTDGVTISDLPPELMTTLAARPLSNDLHGDSGIRICRRPRMAPNSAPHCP